MRLGVMWEMGPNGNYRAIAPLEAMERAGHEVVWPDGIDGGGSLRRLLGCDVVHVYRRYDRETQRSLGQLVSRGVGVTWDNDDDLTVIPRESPLYARTGGAVGRRIFEDTVRTARFARVVTTPTEAIAELYRGAGVRRVEVIDNAALTHRTAASGRLPGVVVGWVAGLEHRADTARIPIAEALARVQRERSDVHVDCIGVDLGLPTRYRHTALVPFAELPRRMSGFDIGIAPLADIPFNRTRSSIKVKEYAACGVPWLASPVGPYVGLGEGEGGQLVADDKWYEAIVMLATSSRARRRLAKKGARWAKRERIETAIGQWSAVFAEAADGWKC